MGEDTLFKLPKYAQLLNIVSELLRAKEWQSNHERFTASLERALNLIDLLLTDPKWRDNLYFLLVLREEVTKVYTGRETVEEVIRLL